MTRENQIYQRLVYPCISEQWVRASTRLSLIRLRQGSTRHLIHLREYQKVEHGVQVLKTMSRDLIILPFMVGRKIMVHDGRKWPLVIPTSREVGLRLGEMAYPKMVSHKHTSKTKTKTVKR